MIGLDVVLEEGVKVEETTRTTCIFYDAKPSAA